MNRDQESKDTEDDDFFKLQAECAKDTIRMWIGHNGLNLEDTGSNYSKKSRGLQPQNRMNNLN